MQASQISNIMSALESAEIKEYGFVTDIASDIYYNNDHSIIKTVGELLVCIDKPQFSETLSNNGIKILASDFTDVHEMTLNVSYDKAKAFLEALGVSLTEDDLKIMINIDKKSVDMEPVTGDYIMFVFLTSEQYNALSDEAKAKYDEQSKFEMKPLINFTYLSKKAYDALTEEDKIKYDELKDRYEDKKSKYLAINQAAQITIG